MSNLNSNTADNSTSSSDQSQPPPGENNFNPPPSQPQTTPPQQEAEAQESTGLETQPVLSEDYEPDPSFQNAKINQRPPFLKLFLIILGLAIVAGALIFFFFFLNKGTLDLAVTPGEALILIDNKEYPNQLSYKVKLNAGEHTLKVNLANYVSSEKKFNIERFKTTTLKVDLKAIPQAQKLLDQKMDFIGLSADKKYLLGLAPTLKTFYRIPVSQQNENTKPTDKQDVSSISSGQAISENNFPNVTNVIWNPKKALAIIKVKNEESALKKTEFYKAEAGNGTITTWVYDFKRYDLTNQEATYLGDDIGDAIWTNDGKKIIYYSIGKKSLYEAEASGSGTQLLKNISSIYNPAIALSPNDKLLAAVPQTTNYVKNYLYLFDNYTKEIKELVKKGNQKGALFNPTSDKVLYSSYADDPSSNVPTTLAIVDTTGENDKDLKIRAEIEKVKFLDGDNLLYAKANDQNRSESLLKYNLTDGTESLFTFNSSDVIHFKNMILSDDNQTLYFISQGYLYSVELVAGAYE